MIRVIRGNIRRKGLIVAAGRAATAGMTGIRDPRAWGKGNPRCPRCGESVLGIRFMTDFF